jgi:hypothetical protein
MPDSPSSQTRYPALERLMTIALGTLFLAVIAAILLGVYALAALVL